MKTIPADDRGLTLGVGLFETVLAVDGRPLLWDAHLDRLERGCAVLALPSPDRALCSAAANEALEEAGLRTGRAAIRLTWTGGSGARGLAAPLHPHPRLLVAATRAAAAAESAALHISTIRRNSSSPASRLKTVNYLENVLARTEATMAGADEALLLDQSGSIACAAAANIFWLEGESLYTPALDCGVLDGVVRDAALRIAHSQGLDAREVHAPPQRLLASDGAFVTNSLQGAVPIRSLDGAELTRSNPAQLMLMTAIRVVALGDPPASTP
ncbi:MAG: aminotransferase class IV [Caulobacteraceae bacterium]